MRNNTIHYGTTPRRSPRTFSASPIISSHLTSSSHPNQPASSSSSSSSASSLTSLSGAPASLANAFSPPNSPKPKTYSKDVLDPGFVFFHLRQMSSEKAKCMQSFLLFSLLFVYLHCIAALKSGDGVERAFNVLDRTHFAETHKIGIMYVGSNQSTEADILGNTCGSPRYCEVLLLMMLFYYWIIIDIYYEVFEVNGKASKNKQCKFGRYLYWWVGPIRCNGWQTFLILGRQNHSGINHHHY